MSFIYLKKNLLKCFCILELQKYLVSENRKHWYKEEYTYWIWKKESQRKSSLSFFSLSDKFQTRCREWCIREIWTRFAKNPLKEGIFLGLNWIFLFANSFFIPKIFYFCQVFRKQILSSKIEPVSKDGSKDTFIITN